MPLAAPTDDTKKDPSVTLEHVPQKSEENEAEVFKTGEGVVEYRTVGWIKAAFIMLKVVISLGVLTLPSTFSVFGAVGASILLVCWTLLNMYMGYVIYGAIGREVVGAFYVVALISACGSGILGASIAFNALSEHAICTVGFTAVALIVSAALASFPKFGQIGVLTWIGCSSIVLAVFIVVVAVTQVDRPAAAPQTGDFDLGFTSTAHPGFTAGMSASDTLFFSSSGTFTFVTVISEMKNPHHYRRAVMCQMSFVTVCYLTFSLVIFAYCGKWVASPSLGSAGTVVKKVSYGIALPGLLITSTVMLHIASKYLFVRLLRNTRHLQENTVVHWTVWLSCVFGLGSIAFAFASVVPFFSDLNGLIGALFNAPLALVLPAICWLYDNGASKFQRGMLSKAKVGAHGLLLFLGIFVTVAGTYCSVVQIQTSYQNGTVGSPFSCADNSNSV